MKQQITKHEARLPRALPLTPDVVRRYIEPKATDEEILLFLNQCAMFGLNPFKREIYLIKYSQKDKASFVVSYETYLKRAHRSGLWNGMESGLLKDEKGEITGAWVKVYRKDWDHPLYHEVAWKEYAQYKTQYVNGQPAGKALNKFWEEKGATMILKVAKSQGLRQAFPDEAGSLPHTPEEIGIDITPTMRRPVHIPEPEAEEIARSVPPEPKEEGAEDPFELNPEPAMPDRHKEINRLVVKLTDSLGYNIAELASTIRAKIKQAYGKEPAAIPQSLTDEQSDRVIKFLNALIAQEEMV